MKILGISGSLRGNSNNKRLLEAAAAYVPEGVELEMLGADPRRFGQLSDVLS